MSVYGSLGKLFGRGAVKAGMGNLAGRGLWGASMRSYSLAMANPAARRAVAGAALGGIYGAFSDNTSVLQGMGMGAAIGGASAPITRGLRAGISVWRNQGRSAALSVMGRNARGYIGQSYTKAVNGFSAMKSNVAMRYRAATSHL